MGRKGIAVHVNRDSQTRANLTATQRYRYKNYGVVELPKPRKPKANPDEVAVWNVYAHCWTLRKKAGSSFTTPSTAAPISSVTATTTAPGAALRATLLPLVTPSLPTKTIHRPSKPAVLLRRARTQTHVPNPASRPINAGPQQVTTPQSVGEGFLKYVHAGRVEKATAPPNRLETRGFVDEILEMDDYEKLARPEGHMFNYAGPRSVREKRHGHHGGMHAYVNVRYTMPKEIRYVEDL